MAGQSQVVGCPTCGKEVKARGLKSHQRIMHGSPGAAGIPVKAGVVAVAEVPGVPVHFVDDDSVINVVDGPSTMVHVRSGAQGSRTKSSKYDTQVMMAQGERKGKRVWVSSEDIIEPFLTITGF